MDSYFDIKALPNPEIIQSAVVAHLMQNLHVILPEHKGRLGLSFPAYGQQNTMGGIIRVLGSGSDVSEFHQKLQRMPDVVDYGLLSEVNEIPLISQYACFTRLHAKGNSRFKRLKKRYQVNGTWTDELEQTVLAKYSVPIHGPHLNLRSSSTGQNFLLFVRKKVVNNSISGIFNSYGLGNSSSSKIATVPWF